MPEKIPEVGKSPVGETAAGSVSIDQFIALNDELAALVRAGLPMERGLRDLGRDIPGALGDTVQVLATRLSHGESLPQALAAERHRFPGVYRAVVEAGLKAGRLSAALEGLASFARSYADLRRAIGMAVLYPLIVLTLAYGLLLFFVLAIVPRFLETYSLFRVPTHNVVAWLRESLPYWGPFPPVLLLLVAVWWIRSGRVMVLQPAWASRMVGWLPWLRGILANSRAACFSELLALLVEHEVPLPEAITLAAEATADDAIVSSAREIAAGIERGDSVTGAVQAATAFPPMLRWLMVTGLQRGALVKALRHAAETYRELALHHANLVKQLLPVVFLLGVGATSAFVYCLSVFEPFTALVFELSDF
jgi:general secretion pathway protein F